MIRYERDKRTMLAPPALRAVHPLGKSSVIEDGGLVLAESGAIVECLIDRYGEDRLAPPPGTPARTRYLYWLHFAEGTAMMPLLLKLYLGRMGEGAGPLLARVDGQMRAHLDYVEAELGDAPFLLGDALTGADIQMSFPLEASAARGGLGAGHPRLSGLLRHLQERPAYRRAIERGGPYTVMS